jgi:hypothetical protein
MQQARVIGRGQLCRPEWLAVGLAVLASGCVSTRASGYGGGFAFSQAECNQTDSTVTCCLKQNPGQYERCGAVAPTTQSQPNNVLPGPTGSEAAPIPEFPTQEERERWRTDICEPHYAKCVRAGGDSIPGVAEHEEARENEPAGLGARSGGARAPRRPAPQSGAGRSGATGGLGDVVPQGVSRSGESGATPERLRLRGGGSCHPLWRRCRSGG